MEQNGFEKDMSLKDVLGGFIESYTGRDTNVAFHDWLADRLRQEMPEMAPEACSRLVDEITHAVEGYDRTLEDLNRAMEKGYTQEEWLSDKLEKAYEGMPMDEAGKALQQMDYELLSSNMQLMGEVVNPALGYEAEMFEWNKDVLREKIRNIGMKIKSIFLCAAADAVEKKVNGEELEVNDIVADAFQNGLEASPSEVKAVVAGAVKVVAEKGLEGVLPSDTPVDVIGGIAGAAVDGAEALYEAANGDISIMEAMDKVGRAGVAAYCRFGADYLKGYIITLPCGKLLVDLLEGLFEHMESPQYINNVYAVVRDAAVATWEGIKSKMVKVGKVAKELKKALLG